MYYFGNSTDLHRSGLLRFCTNGASNRPSRTDDATWYKVGVSWTYSDAIERAPSYFDLDDNVGLIQIGRWTAEIGDGTVESWPWAQVEGATKFSARVLEGAAGTFRSKLTPNVLHADATGYEVVFFDFYRDIALGNPASRWPNSWWIESRVATLSYRIRNLNGIIGAFWDKLNNETIAPSTTAFHEIGHLFLANGDWSSWLPTIGSAPLSSISSFASVISRAHVVLRGMCRRVSLLRIGLRSKYISSARSRNCDRVVVESRFFSTHGFHPPDLELPVQPLVRLVMGYVPGLLPA